MTYVILSVLKLTMFEMKFSLISIDLIPFQSSTGSPINTQMDSSANFTAGGGLGRPRNSPNC